jgi:heme/copper-type cytochrome/quinol oxidase subunit 1
VLGKGKRTIKEHGVDLANISLLPALLLIKNMKSTPGSFFLIVTILFFVIGIFATDKSVDIQIYDTYYVIGYFLILVISWFLMGISVFVYSVLKKRGKSIH